MSPLFEKYIGISILVYRLCSELTMDTMTSRVKSGRLTSSYAYKSQIRLQCCIALYFRLRLQWPGAVNCGVLNATNGMGELSLSRFD